MIVLGLSGLPGAQGHLLRHMTSDSALDRRICQGLDSAACLVVDGRVVAAAAEERFSGEKGTGAMPLQAIHYCLDSAGIRPSDVQVIAHGFDYERHRRLFMRDETYYRTVLSPGNIIDGLVQAGWRDPAARFVPVQHHLAHAASAYYPSLFKEALCIVSDGMGEVDSLSIYDARGSHLSRVHRHSIADSLGLIYSLCTRFLGFCFNADEYKVMGMAAYGDPALYQAFFEDLCNFDSGSIKVRWPREVLSQAYAGYPAAMAFIEARTGLARRQPDSPLTEQHFSFAASLQASLSGNLCKLVSHWMEKTGHHSLCLAGGTFLNCRVNASLCDLPGVRDVFVQPAAGDDGTSLGAALAASCARGIAYRSESAFSTYLGPSYTESEIRAELERRYKGPWA